MKITAKKQDILSVRAELVAAGFWNGKIPPNSPLERLDGKLKGEVERLLKREKFKDIPGQAKLLYVKGRLPCDYLLILGMGEKGKFTLDNLRKCGAALQGAVKQTGVKRAACAIPSRELTDESGAELAQALVEGFFLNGYSFTRYKKKEEKPAIERLFVICPDGSPAALRRAIGKGEALAEAVGLARDCINTPASDMTPKALSLRAKAVRGVRTRVHGPGAVRRMKMGSFLAVASGSTKNPPCFIEMHYKPKGRPKKRIALVGKGVTFDTGGYSIKPAKSMETMKDDMSGAAAVIAVMSLLPRLKPRVAVSGYIAATENMVSGFAQRPGDICTAMDGTTIEVLNTDAEGRLTLADAMLYARKKKPDMLIDMATLTGACMVSLGLLYSGVMGNNDELAEKLIASGRRSGENLWRLPLPEEYKDELKSPVADMKNIGGGAWAGTLVAGLFLQHFAGKTPWAHLDIAGPAWTDKPLPYTPRGGTGVMVRTLARFIEGF